MLAILKKHIIPLAIVYLSILSSYAQQMKSLLHKELIANVATMCEETSDDNDCIGSELYIVLYFETKQVTISELEADSCNKESRYKVGTYPWSLTQNNVIEIESLFKKLPQSGVKILSLELKDSQIIGNIQYLNGKTGQPTFYKKPTN